MKSAQIAYELSDKARKRLAEELFDINKVEAAIKKRAEEGFRDLRIIQTQPFDLSRTPSARTLEDWLEMNQLRYAWFTCLPLSDPQCTPSTPEYSEIAVFW